MSLEEQREIHTQLKNVLAEIEAGKTSPSEHRDLFARHREVNGEAQLE